MSGLRVTEEELRTLLVKQLELIEPAEFARAVKAAARQRVPLERVLVERARIPLGFLLEQLAQAWKVSFVDLKSADVKPEAMFAVPEEYARRHVLMPFDVRDGQLHVAMWDPRDRMVLGELATAARQPVTPYLSPQASIRRAQLLYRADLRNMLDRAAAEEVVTVTRASRPAEDERAAVDLLDRVVAYALLANASDIHVEPYELEVIVRYRVDGVLREVMSLPPAALPGLVARLKIMSGLRTDERRVPQDGRFDTDLGGLKVDLRVSTLPSHWGEKCVIRVLSKEGMLIDLEDLGLTSADYETVHRSILRPFGMVLVTGPTGSGKTTTLYAILQRVGVERHNVVNISTIEDPVEYTMPRVTQMWVNHGAGVDFGAGLRALLRQDPDVIMVGEIRDRDTADIAVRAALVGRLMVSTLHTNDAAGAIPRLLDMGIEPFLLSSTLALVIGQRLVRRICLRCRESHVPDPRLMQALESRPDFAQGIEVLRARGVLGAGQDPMQGMRMFQGKGCLHCHGTGFRGRVGIFELLEVTEEIRDLIMARSPAAAVRQTASARGMATLFQDGLAKAILGETTFEEVFRVAL